jgi:hypothetical protein
VEVQRRDLDAPLPPSEAVGPSSASLRAGDRLYEAMELAREESRAAAADSSHQPSMLLLGRTPSEHVRYAMNAVPANELNQALVVLPLTSTVELLSYIVEWLALGKSVELATRVCMMVLKLHHNQLVATASGSTVANLVKLRDHVHARLSEQQDIVGFNLAALQYLSRDLEKTSGDVLLRDVGPVARGPAVKKSRKDSRRHTVHEVVPAPISTQGESENLISDESELAAAESQGKKSAARPRGLKKRGRK